MDMCKILSPVPYIIIWGVWQLCSFREQFSSDIHVLIHERSFDTWNPTARHTMTVVMMMGSYSVDD